VWRRLSTREEWLELIDSDGDSAVEELSASNIVLETIIREEVEGKIIRSMNPIDNGGLCMVDWMNSDLNRLSWKCAHTDA